MHERRLFVQFIHPGGEHRPDGDGHKEWNTGPHRRKFLTSRGRFLQAGEIRADDLVFWGEWEHDEGLLTGDGSNRQPSTDQLVNHGSADRSETGDNVELRFWQGGLILRDVDGNGVHIEYAESGQ